MSVMNVRTEVQVDKSESPDGSISFPVRDQQYQKFSDNNQGNYSGNNILFDLQSVSNSQQYISMTDSFIIVPVVEHVAFAGSANSVNRFDFRSARTKLISTMKGTACSILNGLQLEVNNEQVLSFTNGSQVPMEFTQISSYAGDDFALGLANDAQYLDASDQAQSTIYYPPGGTVNSLTNTANMGSPWLPIGTQGDANNTYYTTTGTTNSSYYKKLSKMASNARNDVVTAFYDPTIYEDRVNVSGVGSASVASQLQNSRVSYVDVSSSVPAGSQSGEVGTFYYFLKLPLPLIHDFFKQCPLLKGVSLRLTLYVHLPLVYTFTSTAVTTNTAVTPPIPTSATYVTPTSETLNNTTGYMPFSFSYPGPETSAPTCMQGAVPAAYTYTITAGVQSVTVPIAGVQTKISSGMQSCEFWAKMTTLSAPAESLILKDPKKKIVFQDFQRVQQSGMIKISPEAQVTFNVHSGIRKPRGLLITSEAFQKPGGISLPFSSSAIVHTGGASGMPFFSQANLQVRLGGKNIWNWNMQYAYDLFEREIRGLNNAAGNLENALRTGKQIAYYNWLRQNGYIFVDLSKHIESEDNTYFAVDLDLKNPYKIPMGITCYIFYEKELFINVQTGQLFS